MNQDIKTFMSLVLISVVLVLLLKDPNGTNLVIKGLSGGVNDTIATLQGGRASGGMPNLGQTV